jgi:hypothetical protein
MSSEIAESWAVVRRVIKLQVQKQREIPWTCICDRTLHKQTDKQVDGWFGSYRKGRLGNLYIQ